jgi:hypothetical protein
MDKVPTAVERIAGSATTYALRPAPVIVGRALEQIFLREELAAVLGGRGRLVLLSGEAGIGKTTLARDVASEAAVRGIHVLSGACYDLTNTPPYGAWAELFNGCVRRHDLPPLPPHFLVSQARDVTDCWSHARRPGLAPPHVRHDLRQPGFR